MATAVCVDAATSASLDSVSPLEQAIAASSATRGTNTRQNFDMNLSLSLDESLTKLN